MKTTDTYIDVNRMKVNQRSKKFSEINKVRTVLVQNLTKRFDIGVPIHILSLQLQLPSPL